MAENLARGEKSDAFKAGEQRAFQMLSLLGDRQNLAGQLGKSFSGERSLYDELGYPKDLTFTEFKAKYERQDVAGRIVDLPAQDTWRKPPIVMDAEGEETSFVKELNNLAKRLRLWHYMERVDRLSGIGRYGVLLIGLADESELDQPVAGSAVSNPDDVLFLAAFDEGSATVEEIDDDPQSSRFGMPAMYKIDLGETTTGKSIGEVKVHPDRVIHVAEDLLEDEIFGRPRLKRVYNRLEDIEKIVGGGAESIWRLIYKGMVLTTQEGYELPDEGLNEDEIAEYVHGFRRVLELEGVDVNFEGGETVDPSGMFKIIVSLLAGETGIPQRIMLGSERGDLASSQDEANWAGVIESRRENFAEPVMLRAFVDRLIGWEVLPKPDSPEGYEIEWPSLFQLNDLEQVELASKVAETLTKIAPGGTVEMFVSLPGFIDAYLPKLSDSVIDESKLLDVEPTGEPQATEPESAGGAPDGEPFFEGLARRARAEVNTTDG